MLWTELDGGQSRRGIVAIQALPKERSRMELLRVLLILIVVLALLALATLAVRAVWTAGRRRYP